MKSHFHITGWAPRLTLKKKTNVNKWKLPIFLLNVVFSWKDYLQQYFKTATNLTIFYTVLRHQPVEKAKLMKKCFQKEHDYIQKNI